jgi:peptidoglycan/LPS O-acetylase OafA/YrhL
MALVVVLSHASSKVYTDGLTWRAYLYSQPAVIGFFVLSGFVIAYVTDRRERDGLSFTISRIARLYSVVIPALLLTAILDAVGWLVAYEHYSNAPLFIGTSYLPFRYLVGLLMATNLDVVAFVFERGFVPGTNGPFWSMSYEITYYFAFGFITYLKGALRIVLLILLALLAGPRIIILAPIWMFGVAAYYLSQKKSMPITLSGLVLITSFILLAAVGAPSLQFWWQQWSLLDRFIVQDYATGALVTLNIYAAAGMSPFIMKLLSKYKHPVRWLGLLAFPLYLCHRPVLQFVSSFHVGTVGGIAQTCWIFGWIFAAALAVMVISEWLRAAIRDTLAQFTLLWGSTRRKPLESSTTG